MYRQTPVFVFSNVNSEADNMENTGVSVNLLNSADCCCLRERTCINTMKMVR